MRSRHAAGAALAISFLAAGAGPAGSAVTGSLSVQVTVIEIGLHGRRR